MFVVHSKLKQLFDREGTEKFSMNEIPRVTQREGGGERRLNNFVPQKNNCHLSTGWFTGDFEVEKASEKIKINKCLRFFLSLLEKNAVLYNC